MEQEILKKLEEQEKKIDEIHTVTEKIRKYFLISMWLTIIFFVLPLVVLVFMLPILINSYLSMFSGLL